MATSGTLDSKLPRPDPPLLLATLEEGEGDFPYSWNLRSEEEVVGGFVDQDKNHPAEDV